MNKDFHVTIVPAYKENVEIQDSLQLVLPNGETLEVLRPFAILDEQEIEDMLRNELTDKAAKDLVEKVTAKISQWLLNVDLQPLLSNLLTDLTEDNQIRLIFSVDDRLRSRFDLTAVPVELMRLKDGNPFALNPKVGAILHLLNKVGQSPQSSNRLSWPLRVLIVRSEPRDLIQAVPDAYPIHGEILELGNAFGPANLQVDVLSSEPERDEHGEPIKDENGRDKPRYDKPATWDEFRGQLSSSSDPYDILIYLGHGSLSEEGGRSVGHLQFESKDGDGHDEINSDKLAPELMCVPVVLLVGCLTAATLSRLSPVKQEFLQKNLRLWIRGSQSVAQALINSQSGVQIVVGMRYRLETDDAKIFLQSFFKNLLKTKPGNVEAAVYYARKELNATSPFPAAYSAPVIFRAVKDPQKDEPIFPFLATEPPPAPRCLKPAGDWEARGFFWDNLQKLPWAARSQDSKNSILEVLKQSEDRMIGIAVKEAPLILPVVMPESDLGWLIKQPGESITLFVNLYGSLPVKQLKKLKIRLVVGREEAEVLKVEPTKELTASGYDWNSKPDGRQVDFTIEPKNEGGAKQLERLPLFKATIQLGKIFNVFYDIDLRILEVDPEMTVCAGTNRIIVPPL